MQVLVAGCQYDQQVYGGEIRENKRQEGSWAVMKGSSEETRAERNGMMLVVYLPPGTRKTSGPGHI